MLGINAILGMNLRGADVTFYTTEFNTVRYANRDVKGNPFGIHIDYNYNTNPLIYFADNVANEIRYNGINLNRLNGTYGWFGTAAGGNTQLTNNAPAGCVLDYDGDFFVVQQLNNNVRKLELDGFSNLPLPPTRRTITLSIAGSNTAGGGFLDGFYSEATNTTTSTYSDINYIAVDSNNNLYITANDSVRKVTKTIDTPETGFWNKLRYTTTTLVGNNVKGYKDGLGKSALFRKTNGICIDLDDNIYVADSNNHCIRRVTLDGKSFTIAGSTASQSGFADGVNENARFSTPVGLCCDFDGNIYVADSSNYKIRKITKSNTSTKKTFSYQIGNQVDREQAGDVFGYACDMNAAGDRIIIGAYLNSPSATNRNGSARIYNYSGGAWTKVGIDIDGESAGDLNGYSVAMNASGNIVATGAPLNNIGGTKSSAGSVKVYNNGTQLGTDIDGVSAGDWCGSSVSLNAAGDRIAVGSIYNSGNGEKSGSVMVYSYNGTAWNKLGQNINGKAAYDMFGYSVSLNDVGDVVAVGARDSNNAKGSVGIYRYNGTSWVQLGVDLIGPTNGDLFGHSVSLNAAGDRVVIGSTNHDGNNISDTGLVRVFSYNGTDWIQLGSDLFGESSFDRFGKSVSMNNAGDIIVIGAYTKTNPINTNVNAGAFYVYKYNGTSWIKLASEIGEAGSLQLGTSVAINSVGDKIVVGAPSTISPAGNGLARVYNVFEEDIYDYTVSTIAGSTFGDAEGTYSTAKFGNLSDIKMMPNGDLLVCDFNARKVKRIRNTTGYKNTFNITLSSHRRNFDLGKLLLRRGWNGSSPVDCTITILSGVYVYSQRTGFGLIPAFNIPDYLQGSTITIVNSGRIIGSGGDSRDIINQRLPSAAGSDALKTRANITLYNHGLIGGGGGGGGAMEVTFINGVLTNCRVGGGGGAGAYPGRGFIDTIDVNRTWQGSNGALLSGGAAGPQRSANTFTYNGGKGGNLGMAGESATTNDPNCVLEPANRGGYSIDGISFVTMHPSSTGSLSGATIN